MAEFLVRFSQEVLYQPDHPQVVNKKVTLMLVNAPTARGAEIHALRVTQGAGDVISVVPVADDPDAVAWLRGQTPPPKPPPEVSGFQVVDPSGQP